MSVITKFTGLVTVFILLVCPLSARALVVAPMVVDLALAPGETSTFQLAIGADQQASHVGLSLASVSFGEEYSDLVFTQPAEYASWIVFDQSSFLMQENGVRSVNVTVSIPEVAQVESTQFALIVSEYPEVGDVELATSVAALLFLTVDDGTLISTAEVEWCHAALNDAGGYDFEASITNSGQGILQPSGRVIERNMFGHEIAAYPFALSERTPPGYVRTYEWSAHAQKTLIGRWWSDLRGLRIGRLSIACAIDGADEVTTEVWVMSRNVLGTGVVILGAVFGVAIARRRRRE